MAMDGLRTHNYTESKKCATKTFSGKHFYFTDDTAQ